MLQTLLCSVCGNFWTEQCCALTKVTVIAILQRCDLRDLTLRIILVSFSLCIVLPSLSPAAVSGCDIYQDSSSYLTSCWIYSLNPLGVSQLTSVCNVMALTPLVSSLELIVLHSSSWSTGIFVLPVLSMNVKMWHQKMLIHYILEWWWSADLWLSALQSSPCSSSFCLPAAFRLVCLGVRSVSLIHCQILHC